jgi:hypothetical protein
VLVPRFESAPRDNVNPDTQKFLKVLEQADMIKKRRTGLKVHKQIEVTALTGLSPSDGAEHGDPMSPALARDAEDLRAAAP